MDAAKPKLDADKLIALDLDGTLLAEDKSVSPENLAAIERAQREGAVVAIFTGRPYVSADAVVQKLGLTKVPLVAFNGAVIRWPEQGETLYECPLPADLAAEVVEECVQRRLHLHYYLGDEMYVPRNSHWALLYCRRAAMSCTPAGDLRKFAGHQPLKLLVVDEPERIEISLTEYQQRWGDDLYVTRSMPEYLEFINPQVSKGQALDWLAEFYGVPGERIMAAGDRLNDLPLLEHAGHAAAMPEAESPLREAADFVPTDQVTGVAQAIAWFLEGG